MAKLTAKQQQIYDYILSFTNQHGYPPSVREIGAAVGLKSPSTVHFHMKGLEEAGVIVKAEGKTRAISLPGASHGPGGRGGGPPRQPNTHPWQCSRRLPYLPKSVIEDYLTFDTAGLSGEHFALTVRGESMLNAGILPGDLVVVHRQQEARNGEIVVALFEDEATVKTLHRKDGRTWLLPQNPDYPPIDGTKAEIVGKVVAVVRRY